MKSYLVKKVSMEKESSIFWGGTIFPQIQNSKLYILQPAIGKRLAYAIPPGTHTHQIQTKPGKWDRPNPNAPAGFYS